jgi:hypothetical protein
MTTHLRQQISSSRVSLRSCNQSPWYTLLISEKKQRHTAALADFHQSMSGLKRGREHVKSGRQRAPLLTPFFKPVRRCFTTLIAFVLNSRLWLPNFDTSKNKMRVDSRYVQFHLHRGRPSLWCIAQCSMLLRHSA